MNIRKYLLTILESALAISLVGCGNGDDSGRQCSTSQVYSPKVMRSVDLWPDVFLTDPDESSTTGIRLAPSVERAKWIGEINPLFGNIVLDMNGYSGFARLGRIVLRFNNSLENLPTNAAESVSSDALMLFELGDGSNRRIPYEIETQENQPEGVRLIISSLETLKPATQYVLIGSDELRGSNGGCVSPSPLAQKLINGIAPSREYQYAASQYQQAIEQAGYDPDDVAVAVPFITHDEIATVVASRDHIVKQDFSFLDQPECFTEGGHIRCEAEFIAGDYRDETERVIIEPKPQRTYTIPLTVWLPANMEGPFPTILYGHGLSGSRHSAGWLATDLTSLGIAIVAIDAFYHGDHPTATWGGSNGAVEFLGVMRNDRLLDGLGQRGHFNQTQLDRMQLIRLLLGNPDITGDGEPDLNMEEFGYWGISFGGLHGPGTLALADNIDAAVLSVPGGNLTKFISENQLGETAIPFLDIHLSEFGGFLSFLAVVQTLVDPGDPAVWAAHVMRDRFGGKIPHLLMAAAEFDEVVVPETGYSYARGLGIPQMRPYRTKIDPLDEIDGPAYLNFNGVTAGYFQFDRRSAEGVIQAHHNTPESIEALTQTDHFWETWLDGAPEIIDPYPIVGTPPLAEKAAR